MSTPPPWSVLESVPVHRTRVLTVCRDLALPGRGGTPQEVIRFEAPDWVNVVPVTSEGGVVLVRQWRHGSRTLTWEIPGGMVDAGESPREAARRELLEETGYGGGALEPLGVVNPNPALFQNRCHTFLARDVERVAPVRNDGVEETAAEVVSLDRLDALVAEGEIDHALVVAALYWFERWRTRGPY